ncbi:MAG: hypothetical protein JW731_09835 [Bacteroidales bacterium]|nr:hypothetical protein [Bacteroidales bacterium]
MVKIILKLLKSVANLLLGTMALLILIFTIKYITCPVFTFEKAQPFSGNKIYNPYDGIKSTNWQKANFQVQSYAWSGITSGRGNTNQEIYDVYKRLGYDVIATSDYQKINRFREGDPSYIPVYEHGYGIRKNHQVLIGAKKVMWKDYPIFQTIHNKQNILNNLREQNELVYIAHPKLREGYQPEDMELLSNYDGIEVLNNYRTSLEHWDAALSSGKYVTILGNDDAHDISNPDEIGHHCTFINAPTNRREDVISALKAGRSFGAKIYRPNGESFADKIDRIRILPIIQSVEVKNDTLFIECDSVATAFRFLGQNGRILKTSGPSASASYHIQAEDHYVRAEIEFPGKSIFYLNPIARYDNKFPHNNNIPVIDTFKTSILRIIGFASLVFIFLNILFLRKRIKSDKK